MVMHYHIGVSPVNFSDYDSLHKVYLKYYSVQNRAVIHKLKAT